MNAERYYQWMKEALNYFGVPWGKKDTVGVIVKDNIIWFTHDGETVSYGTIHLLTDNEGC